MSQYRVFAPVIAAGLVLYGPAFAQSSIPTVTILVDEAKVINFAAPVKTIYLGNPTIADVTVIDARRAFLQGKSFGTTNLIALDGEGRQIAEERIAVQNRAESMVTLQRGPERTTMSCIGERCEVNPIPGDQAQPFDTVRGQIEKRDQQLKQAAATRK